MRTSWIRERRGELHITQEELAARLQLAGLDVTRATVSHWENGRHALPLENPIYAKAIADALKLSVRDVLILAGYDVSQKQPSRAAQRAAHIIDSLPKDKQDLAIRILEQLSEN